jgi:hypothetical protein
MNKLRLLALMLSFTFIFISGSLSAAVPSSDPVPSRSAANALRYAKDLKVSDVEQFLGRKMSFGEKLAFRMHKKEATQVYAQMQAGDRKGPVMGLAIWALVLSFLGPVGLVLSLIALHRFKKEHEKRGRGFAIAGLIISIASTVAWLMFLL